MISSRYTTRWWNQALRSLCIVSVLSLAAGHVAAQGQQPARLPEGTVRVALLDGTTVVGVIEETDEVTIVLVTRSQVRMEIPREQIRSITSVAGRRFDRGDPNETRLLFAPTARPLRSGAGYVAFYEIFVPFFAVGVGPFVSLAGGVTVNPGPDRLLYVAPKVTFFDTERVSWAGGFLVGTLTREAWRAGIVYTAGTYGSSEAAVTFGTGFGFDDKGNSPVFMLGAEYQVSRSVKLLTENYAFPTAEDALMVSGGIRFFGDRLAAEVGLVTLPLLIEDSGSFPFLPWIGFAYNFVGLTSGGEAAGR